MDVLLLTSGGGAAKLYRQAGRQAADSALAAGLVGLLSVRPEGQVRGAELALALVLVLEIVLVVLRATTWVGSRDECVQRRLILSILVYVCPISFDGCEKGC